MQNKIFNFDRVAKVYSGRIGCMCGCNGKYSYNTGVAHEDWQGKESTRSVKIIARKVFLDPNTNWTESQEYCFVEDRDRGTIKVVYFKK